MTPGQRLAHYRILERLGAGGMGEVYKAVDTHLNRTVAIKVLLPEAVAEPVRRQRFIQEARAASAIEHPNIVTIYDIAEAEGQHFIVMQYVAGRTLRALLNRDGLALNDALRYAVQVSDALAQAHARGIVHRDLKPENIMVIESEGRAGQIKILDFGLAKLTEPADSDEYAPTRSIRAGEELRTEEGTILGTAAYMSPEQAEGKKVDARSDIFSFGSVLYEMVTGQRAFHGETRMATLSGILRQEPKPMGELVPEAPPQLEWIIHHCLRKDPNRRYQHMDDVKTAIEELQEASESGQLAVAAPRHRPWMLLAVAGGVGVLAMVAGLSWWLAAWRGSAPQPVQGPVLTRLTSDTGLTTQPALSPKGDLLAYASDRSGEGNLDIWVQQIGGGQPLRLTRHEADDEEPAFSPDGTRIAFRSGRDRGGIYVVPALGGDERLAAREGRGPRFSPDGTQILYWVGLDYGKLYVVPSTGGAPRQVRPDFYSARNPVWAPDGKYILFHGSRERNELIEAESYDWWVSPLDGRPPARTGAVALLRSQGLTPASRIFLPDVWLPETNQVLFAASLGDTTNLWKVGISPSSWRVSDAPQRLSFGTGIEMHPSGAGRGRLVFASLTKNLDIWGVPIDANRAKVLGELQRWTHDPAIDMQPSVSADGKRVVFASGRSGNLDIWLKELESGRETPLTLAPAAESFPAISQDGSKAAYMVREGSSWAVYTVAIGLGAGGGIQPGAPEKLCEDCALPYGWSSDGKKVIHALPGTTPVPVRLTEVLSRQSFDLLRHPEHNLWQGRFSPDNRWVAFVVQHGLAGRLYVAPFRNGPIAVSDWTAIADFEAGPSDWSPDGQALYLASSRDGFRCLWYIRLDPATKRPAGPPAPLYHLHRARLSMMHLESPQRVISVARDKIVFTLGELTGNIWVAKFER